MEALRRLRSVLALLLALLWFVPGGLVLYLFVLPAGRVAPSRRLPLATWYVKMMSRVFLGLMRAGGARFDFAATAPTGIPALVVANHQSLLDICIILLMSEPHAVAFVARRRYAMVPVVGAALRAVGCPVIDPVRDRRGSLAVVAEASRALERGILIFPEGHRSRDGEILPWRTAGLLAILGARRRPVYLVVTDGLWRSPTLLDFVFHVHELRSVTEVLGPFEPPAEEEELPAFVEGLRATMVEHLAAMRGRGRGVAA